MSLGKRVSYFIFQRPLTKNPPFNISNKSFLNQKVIPDIFKEGLKTHPKKKEFTR